MTITAQEIFDTVSKHLRSLPRQSKPKNSGRCSYKTPDGLRCAVGVLLTDEELLLPTSFRETPSEDDPNYYPWLEYKTIDDLEDAGVYTLHNAGFLPERLLDHVALLQDLQTVHDHFENWSDSGFTNTDALTNVAIKHGLNP